MSIEVGIVVGVLVLRRRFAAARNDYSDSHPHGPPQPYRARSGARTRQSPKSPSGQDE
jgi:hypothetical protein